MIKIDFCDMPNGYVKEDNPLIEIVKKYFGEYEITEHPDFLFYSCMGTKHYEYQDCVKIFYTDEAVTPNFSECDYAIAFDHITFGDRYFRRPVWQYDVLPKECRLTDEEAINRKFCNFVYSNEHIGEAVEFRKQFALKLMEYKHVDCPGKVLNNMENAITPRKGTDRRSGKVEFIKDYKFTIAFENSRFDGYTTEKMLEPITVHSIPVYWGNPRVTEDFNEKAFINCNGYENNMDEIVKRVIELDQDDAKYLEMLHQKPMCASYDEQEIDKYEQFIVEIIKRGNHPINKDPLEFGKRMTFGNESVKSLIRKLIKKIIKA